jgi:hypothetical protein
MARGSLSLESRLPGRLAALNVSLRTFCALSDLKLSTLSGILNGKRDFTISESERIETVLAEMSDLQNTVNDLNKMLLPIAWDRTNELGTLLTVRRTVKMWTELDRSANSVVEERV